MGEGAGAGGGGRGLRRSVASAARRRRLRATAALPPGPSSNSTCAAPLCHCAWLHHVTGHAAATRPPAPAPATSRPARLHALPSHTCDVITPFSMNGCPPGGDGGAGPAQGRGRLPPAQHGVRVRGPGWVGGWGAVSLCMGTGACGTVRAIRISFRILHCLHAHLPPPGPRLPPLACHPCRHRRPATFAYPSPPK